MTLKALERVAGGLYVVGIGAGLSSELAVRGSLVKFARLDT